MNIPCQIYAARHLLQVLWLACVLCVGTGCAGWHDARMIVQKADSMDVHGILYEDTAALRQVINTWEKPVLRTLMHDDLGKAYYYLARNKEDRYQQYTEAAECYIRSDQLHMSDPVRRGRVNSCMESICSKEDALEFNGRALQHFYQSGNTKYYVSSLLIRSSLVQSVSRSDADSIWKEACTYSMDSVTVGLSYIVRGAYYYYATPKNLDSALIYYKRVESYQMPPIYDCWYALQLMKVYYRLDSLPQAVNYAKYVLANSSTPKYGISAYYVLMEQAEKEGDVQKLGEYAHARADLQWEMSQNTAQITLARQILADYAHSANRHSDNRWLGLILLCIGGCIVLILVVVKNRRNASAMVVQEEGAEPLQKKPIHTAEQVEVMVQNFSNYAASKPEIWSSDFYAEFCEVVDLYLCNMVDKLHRAYHLSPQDTKICILTLMGQSRKEMATKLYRSESSIPKLRSRTAKQMGTDSIHLREFLIGFIAK